MSEPYESMPEGPKHAVCDWLAGLLASSALIIGIIALAWTDDASANNWCADWADGYAIGFCWSRENCSYIPPKVCPYPQEGETDGYMRGLNDGLKDGSVML
jgi:hypothetical protein